MGEGYGIRVALKYPLGREFCRSLATWLESQSDSPKTVWHLTFQLPSCASHVTFVGCTTRELSRKINFFSNLHLLNTKLNTIKSHKIQGNQLM